MVFAKSIRLKMRLFLSLLLLIKLGSAYKILVFSPTISRSHMISNGRIADELAKAGHDVVLFEPDFLRIFDKVKSAKLARRWPVHGFSNQLAEVLHGFSGDVFEEANIWEVNLGLVKYQRAFNQYCKDMIYNDDLMQQLRDEKFDAYFGEQINWCGNGIAHALDIKTHFWVSSCTVSEPMAWVIGMPMPLSYVPVTINMDIDNKPSYLERAQNIFYATTGLYYTKIITDELTDIFKERYGSSFPRIEDIVRDSDMIFVSTDEFIEFPRPILPNVVHIGGLGLTDGNVELGKTFEAEMSKGEKGVIYFSLGTNVNTTALPPYAMRSVMWVASRFPQYHFVIRIDEHDAWSRSLASEHTNVGVHEWVPQPALLKHARLRCFITHAGYNGVIEAARAGVPLITMPFMFDQTKNSRAIALNGWGIPLSRQVLKDSPEKLEEALRTMLGTDRFKKAALRVQNLVRNKPFSASERLIRHTEFVLSNGGMKELLVEGRNLSLFKYYNLDIFIPIIIVLLSVVLLGVWTVYAVVRRLVFAQKNKTKRD